MSYGSEIYKGGIMLRKSIVLLVVLALTGCGAVSGSAESSPESSPTKGGASVDIRGEWDLYIWKDVAWRGPMALHIGGTPDALTGRIVDIKGREIMSEVIRDGHLLFINTEVDKDGDVVYASYRGVVDGAKIRGRATDSNGKTVHWMAERHREKKEDGFR